MAVDVAEVVDAGSERKRLAALVDRILPIAKAADAIASRSVKKVRNVALLGSLSAVGLTYACALTFAWGLAAALSMLVPLLIPSLVLWKIHGTLHGAVGLPQRLVATCDRLFGKFAEYRHMYAERQSSALVQHEKPKFRNLWRTARSLLELKALGDEGRELWSTMAGAVVMTSPIFAIAMFVAMSICLLMIGIATIVGVTFAL